MEKIKQYIPSKETFKRALLKAWKAGLMGALAAFASLPINLNSPSGFLRILIIGLCTGFLVGLQKLVSGYLKYDRLKK